MVDARRATVLPLGTEHLATVGDLVAEQTGRRVRAAGLAEPDQSSLMAAAGRWLAPYVGDGPGFARVALDGDRAIAVLGGLPTRLTPQDAGYTYMAPRHVLCPLSGWAARDETSAVVVLPQLLAAVRDEALAQGLERVDVQVLDADWFTGGVWRAAGLRPDTTMAFRPLADADADADRGGRAERWRVRPAGEGDLTAMASLAMEEVLFHARHTGSGTAVDQDPATVRANVAGMLDHDAPPDVERAFVVEDSGGDVVGITTAHVLTAATGSLGSLVLPPRYGYLGLTDVADRVRGRGAGGALLRHALAWLRAQPDPPPVVGLHYVVDNVLSAPFWSDRGFAPALTLLTTAPRHRER